MRYLIPYMQTKEKVMALIEKDDEEYRPLYIVTINGKTMIVNSLNAVKHLCHGVSGASQVRIDNKRNKKEYLETLKEYGTFSQYEYFKSLVDKEESGEDGCNLW